MAGAFSRVRKRRIVFAFAGIALVGLAALCVRSLSSFFEVNAELKHIQASPFPAISDSVQRLGGERRAARKLDAYLRIAKWADRIIMRYAPNEMYWRRQTAITLLRGCGAEAVSPLVRQLKDERDPLLKRLALRSLAHIGLKAEAAIPAVTEALDDEDEIVRLSAIICLRKICPPQDPVMNRLQKIVVTGTSPLSEEARNSLSNMTDHQ